MTKRDRFMVGVGALGMLALWEIYVGGRWGQAIVSVALMVAFWAIALETKKPPEGG